MKHYNRDGHIYTFDLGIWYCSGGFKVSPWWQDRLNKYYF